MVSSARPGAGGGLESWAIIISELSAAGLNRHSATSTSRRETRGAEANTNVFSRPGCVKGGLRTLDARARVACFRFPHPTSVACHTYVSHFVRHLVPLGRHPA